MPVINDPKNENTSIVVSYILSNKPDFSGMLEEHYRVESDGTSLPDIEISDEAIYGKLVYHTEDGYTSPASAVFRVNPEDGALPDGCIIPPAATVSISDDLGQDSFSLELDVIAPVSLFGAPQAEVVAVTVTNTDGSVLYRAESGDDMESLSFAVNYRKTPSLIIALESVTDTGKPLPVTRVLATFDKNEDGLFLTNMILVNAAPTDAEVKSIDVSKVYDAIPDIFKDIKDADNNKIFVKSDDYAGYVFIQDAWIRLNGETNLAEEPLLPSGPGGLTPPPACNYSIGSYLTTGTTFNLYVFISRDNTRTDPETYDHIYPGVKTPSGVTYRADLEKGIEIVLLDKSTQYYAFPLEYVTGVYQLADGRLYATTASIRGNVNLYQLTVVDYVITGHTRILPAENSDSLYSLPITFACGTFMLLNNSGLSTEVLSYDVTNGVYLSSPTNIVADQDGMRVSKIGNDFYAVYIDANTYHLKTIHTTSASVAEYTNTEYERFILLPCDSGIMIAAKQIQNSPEPIYDLILFDGNTFTVVTSDTAGNTIAGLLLDTANHTYLGYVQTEPQFM